MCDIVQHRIIRFLKLRAIQKNPSAMEWVGAKDFPQEMTDCVQNLDSALNEMEAVVNQLTSVPLTDAHSNVSLCRSNSLEHVYFGVSVSR